MNWSFPSALLVVACATLSPAFCGTVTDTKIIEPDRVESTQSAFRVKTSYVAPAEVAGETAKMAVVHSLIEGYHEFPMSNSDWFLRVGLSYGRSDFGTVGLVTPSHLQHASFILGLEFRKAGQTAFLLESRPGFYFANRVALAAFDAPTLAGFAYPVTKDFALVTGISVAALREYPLLPAIGFRWKPSGAVCIRFILPEPRVEWQASETCILWLGGEMVGGAFRSDRDGASPESLNNAIVSYREIRIGGGITWKAWKEGAIEASLGYAMDRSFDYHRAGEEYEIGDAPYARLSIVSRF